MQDGSIADAIRNNLNFEDVCVMQTMSILPCANCLSANV